MKINQLMRNLMHPGNSLSQRVVRSGFWVAFYKVVERGFRFVKTMIIARLLAPSDFGLFGIACLALEVLQTFTETGIGSALIQKRESIEDYLNTAWTIQIVRATILCVLIYIFAVPIAGFFNNSQAIPLMKIIALNILFSGFANIGVVYFTKEIEFIKQRTLSFSQLAVEFIVSIVLAFTLRNAWALVWGMLAGRITNCIFSYVMHPYRPRFHFEIKKAKELMHFGKWVFGLSIIVFLCTQGDGILIGRVLGTTALGLYAMASAIANLPASEVTSLFSQIIFPAYSKFQTDINKLRKAYFSTLGLVIFVTIPLTIGIILLGKEFVKIFLKEKWLPMVPAMQLLAIAGLIRSIIATGGCLFSAVGVPKKDFQMNIYRLVTMLISIYPLAKLHGVNGVAISIVLSIASTIPAWFFESKKITKAKYIDYGLTFLPVISAALLMSISIICTKPIFSNTTILNLISISFIACTVYLLVITLFWKQFKLGPIGEIKLLKSSI